MIPPLDFPELARALAPEAVYVAGALAILAYDLAFGRGRSPGARAGVARLVTRAALVVAAAAAFAVRDMGDVFGGVLALDGLALANRIGVSVLLLLVVDGSAGARIPPHPAEHAALVLLAASGLSLLGATQHLLLGFLALELTGLSLYALVGFDRARPESAEAGLKYFLFGGMAAAFMLFGFSLLYGLTGQLHLGEMAVVLAHQPMTPLHGVALVMVLVAFGYKAAAAPFHLWAPDAYEGGGGTASSLVASASKLAGLAFFARLLWPGLGVMAGSLSEAPAPGWLMVAAVLSLFSLLVGNLVALAQTRVRRLLAYSAIAHAGVMTLGVMTAGRFGPTPVVYYAFTYGIATAGAFAVLGVLERERSAPLLITDLAGLSRRSPYLAVCLAVFLLSLAGVPPLAGFFGKFLVFAGGLRIAGLAGPAGWLALAAIAASAVGLYYYLLVLKQAWVVRPGAPGEPVEIPWATRLSLGLAVFLLFVLGVYPQGFSALL